MAKCQQAPAICCYGSGTEVKCTVGQFCCVMAQSQVAAFGGSGLCYV